MDGQPSKPEEQELRQGQVRVHLRVQAPPGVRVRVTLNSPGGQLQPPQLEPSPPALAPRLPHKPGILPALGKTLTRLNLEAALFALALLVYAITRLTALPAYPIFFFTDEAVQTVTAADLVHASFHGPGGELLPTYFVNGYQYNLSTSVYLQVLPYILFGKSIWVTRATCALVSLLAALCAGLTMKHVFHNRFAWMAVLLLGMTPAWFLHSRTAFETSLAVSFYAAFLYFYLRYRTASPHYLYPAVVLGALAFYSYSPARMVVLLTALLFFFSDIRHHLKNWRWVLIGLGLALLCAAPLIRFQAAHPEENLQHLKVLNSYWIRPLPLTEKLGMFSLEYLRGLNPFYWFLPNKVDLARHTMKGYGHILIGTLPFFLLGLGIAIAKIRSAPHRAILLSLLAAPSGAALVALGITRALVFVIPAALLTTLGLSAALEWVLHRWRVPRLALVLPLVLVLGGTNIWMLTDALVNGPQWFTSYGLEGMQYGARQLFAEIDTVLAEQPGVKLLVSPSWSNGTDTVARFFYPDVLPFQMGSIDGYFDERKDIEGVLFVMIPEEYDRVLASPKFTDIRVERTLPYPDGRTGFYFVRLRYVDTIDAILAAERAARAVLQEASLPVDGAPARVQYSYLDMGSINLVFDGDTNTLIRTMEANPLKVYITFESPHALQGLMVMVGGTATQVDVRLLDEKNGEILAQSQTLPADPNPRSTTFGFGTTFTPTTIQVEVTSLGDGEPAHVHLWEVTLK